jgi:hypothetical protein
MLLGHSHTLAGGMRVRLRLPHAADRARLEDLALRVGLPVGDLEAGRLLLVRPHARTAICATAWIDGTEALVGFAAGDLAHGAADVLLADERRAPGVSLLLERAIAERSGLRSVA